MKPNTALLAMALGIAPSAARANEYIKLVDFTCDGRANRIVVAHFAREGTEGRRLLRMRKPNRFWPAELVIVNKKNVDRIAGVKTVRRTCRLRDGLYTFALSGSPNNFNIQGRCGAVISGRVEIVRNQTQIVDVRLEGDCHSDDPVVTRITVTGGQKEPEFIRTPQGKFLE
jgi:hypothetical protein